MSVHYSRPGHFEETFSAAETAQVPEPMDPIYSHVHGLIGKARAAGATDEDLHEAIAVAEDTVKAILADRVKVS